MVEYGIVKFFDQREGKRFGFLTVLDQENKPTKEEVFFHYNDGQLIACIEGVATFVGSSKQRGSQITRLNYPQKGDMLVFCRAPGKKGYKATPWGYGDQYHTAVQYPKDHPLLRVMRSSRKHGRTAQPRRVWIGRNTIKLSVHFPKVLNGSRTVHDDLAPKDEGGLVVATYELQMQVDATADVWMRCPDPRTSLCCIPQEQFQRFAREGQRQPACHH